MGGGAGGRGRRAGGPQGGGKGDRSWKGQERGHRHRAVGVGVGMEKNKGDMLAIL